MFKMRLAWKTFLCAVGYFVCILLTEFFLSCAADLIIIGVKKSIPSPTIVMLIPFIIIPITLFVMFLVCYFFPGVIVKYKLGYFETKESALDFTKP